jgi:putative ABC transport system permease protein
MNLLESFRLAVDAIIANKMRSILTTLGVIIGVFAVVLMVSIGQGLQSQFAGVLGDIGVNTLMVQPNNANMGPGMSVNKLKLEYAKKIEQGSSYVDAVSANIVKMGTVKSGSESMNTVMIAGITANYAETAGQTVEFGNNISEAQVDSGKKVALIGKTVADELFGGSNAIGRKITIEGQKFTIIGQAKPKGSIMGMDQDKLVAIPITIAQRLFSVDTIDEMIVKVVDENSVDLAKADVIKTLEKYVKKEEFMVSSQQQMLEQLQGISTAISLALGGIASISLLVGGIGIMNIMLVSVTERTKEIGIRKAVGAKTYNILMQFTIEAATISVIGGLIGTLMSLGVSMMLKSSGVPSEVSIVSIIIAFLFSAGIGIFFGAYPAFKASRLSPIEALRHE